MTVWDLGDRVAIRHQVRDADGELVDATVTLVLIAPDGVITTPAPTHTSTGTYDVSVLSDQTGQWRYIWTVAGTVDDKTTGTFDVADPAPPLYYPLALFKKDIGGIDPDDASRDEQLTLRLDVASRGIENNTNRRQYYLDRAVTVRTYRVRGRVTRDRDGYHVLEVDDIGSTTGMVVEIGCTQSGWTAVTDYETGPDNALADRRAIETLRRRGGWGTQYVRVTARHGWPAVPVEVRLATQLQASRLNKRTDSPEGFVGSAEWGPVRLGRVDVDVAALVEKLVRIVAG